MTVKMKRIFILVAITVVLFSVLNFCQAQEEEGPEKILVLREAKEYGKANVAVEAYLIDDILEVKVAARVYASRPQIDNVIVVGPKLGRLSAKMKTALYATEEEEDPFATTESRGLIGFGRREETKKTKGTVAKALYKFKIPRDKIIQGKRYELRVKIGSMKIEGKFLRFKFELKDLPQLILQQ